MIFWDTANLYGFGRSEEIDGRAPKKYGPRGDDNGDQDALQMHDGPGGAALSREAIVEQIDASHDPPRHRLRRPVPDPPL
jgi:aryl-alcohol dehydrogenase-like predicted oxidoreductase